MFKHLLVPLDGSSLAEVAIPYAVFLAKQLGAAVTLIHVIERHPPQMVHGATHLTDAMHAQAYLDKTAQAFSPDTTLIRHVHSSEVNEVARSIVEHAGELLPDLIVMCSHGETGLRDLLYGNIAQQVISMGRTPVLLIPPPVGNTPPVSTFSRILVPLDGDTAHEQGIENAVDLAGLFHATIHLLVVVHTPGTLTGEKAAAGRMLPGMTAELLKITLQGAQDYISNHETHVRASGISVSSEVARGDPAKTIIATAGRLSSDLIVLGTHGKSGLDAFWQGSVAPKVSSQSHIPLLLMPLHD